LHPINPSSFDDDALEAARRELNEGPAAPREFVYACPLSAVPADGRRGRAIPFENDEVAIFNLNGEIFATSNLCPHEMSPLLAAGFIDREQQTVACPLHGWIYHIPTGRLLGTAGIEADMGCPLKTYEVKVVDGEVWVEEPTIKPSF
jgi:nitrite reductase/ring-hydroxylating ferredoxin subunit